MTRNRPIPGPASVKAGQSRISHIVENVFEYSPTTSAAKINHFDGPSGEDFKSLVFEGVKSPKKKTRQFRESRRVGYYIR
jgi:hypothetical protein